MKLIKIMGLCLVAAFVMSAVTSAVASAAEPEFRFEGSKKFSYTSQAGKLETSNGEEVNCKTTSGTGEIEGTSGSKKVTEVKIAFHGCTSTILAKTYKCKSTGAAEEEIKTNTLEGELGYVNKTTTPREVGLLLKPVGGGNFATFECVRGEEAIKITVKGSIIGRVPTINILIDIFSFALLDYEKGTNKGEPKVTKFEGGAENELLTESTISKKFLKSAISGSILIFGFESYEIKA